MSCWPQYGISCKVSIIYCDIRAFTDLPLVQKQAVEQHKVLHRDCSLFNAMIGDNGSGTYGMLIDWEFAVRILKNESYTVGGTISILN